MLRPIGLADGVPWRRWGRVTVAVGHFVQILAASGAMATPPMQTPEVFPLAANAPEDVVRSIYTLPDPDFGVFAEPHRRPEVYTPRIVQLAARMDACYRAKYGMAELDFNFIVPGQDYDIRSVHVGLVRQTDTEAEVRVVLMNPDMPVVIEYRLQRINEDWRVDDVLFFGGETSMSKFLAGPC